MKVQRTLDTSDARYDLIGLTLKEFELLHRAYLKEIHSMYNGPTDKDELLNKLTLMSTSDTLVI